MIGERGGLSGWLRWLGTQLREPPDRHWDLRQVAVVTDESDLTAAAYGPRAVFGGQIAGAVNSRSVIAITAGSRGARVGVDLQVGDPAAAIATHQIAQFRITDGRSALVTSVTDFAPQNQGAVPIQTRAEHGRLTDADYGTDFPVGTSAAYAIKPTIAGGVSFANTFFHIGYTRMRPFLWLEPGKTLYIAGQVSGAAVGWYVSGYIEEPGSPRD